MEKLESKLRHMEYFVMKSQNTTIEEKLELLEAIGEMKKKVQKINRGRSVETIRCGHRKKYSGKKTKKTNSSYLRCITADQRENLNFNI